MAQSSLLLFVFCLVLKGLVATHERAGDEVQPQNTLRDRRIIGGEPAGSELIWITYISKFGTDSKRCSGNLLSPRWMVTAAHCMLNADDDGYLSPEGTVITYGCLDIYSSSCKTVSATRFVPHPCYTPSKDQDHDDIALVELSEEVELEGGDFALIDGVDGTVPWEQGRAVTLAGFGVTESGSTSPDLLAVEVPVAAKDACEGSNPYALSQEYVNFDCVFCTGGAAGKDSCNGDSGGPAVAWVEGRPWLVGILSVGSELPREGGCGVDGRYGMYTFVRRYADFINSTMTGTAGLPDPCVCASGTTVLHSASWGLALVQVLAVVAWSCFI